MLEILEKGGPIMYAIIMSSIVAVAIVLERFYSLRKSKVIPQDWLSEVTAFLRKDRVREALGMCRSYPTPMSNIIIAGITNRARPRDEIKEAVEDAGRHEIPALRRYLTALGTIAGVSPLLGLLGTVTGMIKVFRVIEVQGPGDPGALAGGIWEALLTTAAGLSVAIPALVAYHFFASKSDRLVIDMEKQSMVLLRLLEEIETGIGAGLLEEEGED